MARRKRVTSGLALGVLLLGGWGCERIAKQGLAEVRGARGKVFAVSDYHPSQVAAYRSVVFEPVSSTLTPRVMPSDCVPGYDRGYRLAADEDAFRERFPGAAPELRVSTEVQYFQGKGLLSEGLLIARVRLREAGRQVGDLLVRVTSESFRDGDADEIAEEGAKTLARFLADGKQPEN